MAAAIDFDGSTWGEDYKKPISKPMMIVSSSFYQETDRTLETTWANLPKRSYKVEIDDVAHSSFSDYILIARSMGLYQSGEGDNPNPMDATRAIQITRDLVRTFFDVNLKQADPRQINRISKRYQEVKVEEK